MLCLDFGQMLEMFDILEASVQGRAAVSETVRTQILNICRGKKIITFYLVLNHQLFTL